MSKQVARHIMRLLAIVFLLGSLWSRALGQPLVTGNAPEARLDRNLEPVILTGANVPALLNLPVDRVLFCSYSGGSWRRIPGQIDEVTEAGAFTSQEDGLLDRNDQLVFMAKDLGDQAPPGPLTACSGSARPTAYQVEVDDPLTPTQRGWAVVVSADAAQPEPAGRYVSFNSGWHRIIADNYALSLGATISGIDYLSLMGSSTDILDRTKERVFCRLPMACPLTEDALPVALDNLIKNGPVRLILRGGRMMAYGGLVQWTRPYTIPATLAGNVRVSTDFTPAVSGSTFYNAAVPQGVIVDGIPDAVPELPASNWWQLSTNDGTVIQAVDSTEIGGRQVNYYVDDSSWDAIDTGDRAHYGDTGIAVQGPNLMFTITVRLSFLPGRQPNMGERYEGFFQQPLLVTTNLLRGNIYLPIVTRYPGSGPVSGVN